MSSSFSVTVATFTTRFRLPIVAAPSTTMVSSSSARLSSTGVTVKVMVPEVASADMDITGGSRAQWTL